MKGAVETTADLVRAIRRAKERKGIFLSLFALIFVTTVLFLGWLDLLPNSPFGTPEVSLEQVATTTPVAVVAEVVEVPVEISIPTIELKAMIANPETTSVAALDAELLKGAVRYPTSAKLGQDGNVVLFGHSSYLPVVGNRAYKAFNDIQKLKAGDEIIVSSSGRTYTYAVRTVEKESATEGAIPLSVAGRVLTLVTCNSFGQKTDRFIVVADLVESHPIGA